MLTQEQIDEKTFKKGLFGYNKEEVNAFKREMASEYAELKAKYDAVVAENEISKKSLQENSVKIYELEKQLEQAAPGSKKEQNAANSEANKIINEAKKRANDVLANAKTELAKLKAEMEELRASGGASSTTTSVPDIDESALDSDTTSSVEADPITKLKMKSQTSNEPQKLKMKPKEESKPQAFAGKTAVTEDEEEEEVIVGEIEEGVKRNQVLIGDGDDEDADFEFL